MHLVYILYSKKLARFYIGYTSDIITRMSFHEIASSNKFTGKADDWELFITITCDNKQHGLKIEKHIKDMKSQVYIHNLILYPEIIIKLKDRFKSEC